MRVPILTPESQVNLQKIRFTMCLCISQIQSGFTMLFHDMFHDVFVYESGLGCLISFDPDMFHDMFVYESGLGCLISFDPDLFHDMFVH